MALYFSSLATKYLLRGGVWETLLVAAMLASFTGCQKAVGTADPQLKPIQAMLEQQLPPRTPEEKVVTFLDNHGYPILAAQKQGTIVANIRRTDTATVQPVIAQPLGIGLARRASHPHAALLFADFVLSPEGQALFNSLGRPPASRKVQTALGQFESVMMDPALELDESDKWEKIWKALFLNR